MTVQLESPSYTRIHYSVRFYRAGKPAGVDDFFDSMADIKMYHSDSQGRLPKMTHVRWNEKVPADAEGLVVIEHKMRHSFNDPPQGTRLTA